FSYAQLNDLASVERLADGETCAVIVEPVQGESGVHPCQAEFLRGLRALCDRRRLLLIFDEVQTAPARLGTWFGYQYFGVEPDIITTAKAIAGGMPLGAMLAKAEVAAALVPGTHASTFGGNAICCAAGLAAFQAIAEEGMLENVQRLGKFLDERLALLAQQCPTVKETRRAGFMIGIEIAAPGAEIVNACREQGLLINCTHERVLRLLPAFNVKEEELAQGLDILARCLASR
ncbi:MAG: aminotransferase class III-fold pyridoxal phosphate-dependent enzyme, partial [Planctomycetota bacterium]|nr:aminotransferase class III-fold pyridoxal phosphate-dependent enzyme [Planctomycetota bacterium]